MGIQEGVGYDEFPKQGPHLGKRVNVCFRFNTSKLIGGECVRDDYEEPWLAIFKLDDGRYILATECQYNVED